MIPKGGWKCACVWEGRNTHARKIFEYARSVKSESETWNGHSPLLSRIKGTSHCVGHHRRHPLVLWPVLLNLTTKQKLRWINSMRTPCHCKASMCGKCSLERETILFDREIEHACVLMSAPHRYSAQMNYTGLIETKHLKDYRCWSSAGRLKLIPNATEMKWVE